MHQINSSNRVRVKTAQVPEQIDVSNSVYKIRLTPASAKQVIKNRESIFITNNSQAQLKTYPPQCAICKSDIGKFYFFCLCQNIQYHDKCFLDNVRSRAKQIHEGAFSCGYGCDQEYRIKCYFEKHITFHGYLLAVALFLIIMLFTIIFVLLILYWNEWTAQIPIIIVLLLLLIMILTLLKNVKLQYYKIIWTIKPIDEGYFKETDFHTLLPFVLHNRDALYYNSDLDTIGCK